MKFATFSINLNFAGDFWAVAIIFITLSGSQIIQMFGSETELILPKHCSVMSLNSNTNYRPIGHA